MDGGPGSAVCDGGGFGWVVVGRSGYGGILGTEVLVPVSFVVCGIVIWCVLGGQYWCCDELVRAVRG